MSSDQERRRKEIFSAACGSPPLEPAAFLGRACGGDAEPRRQADSLLAAHEQALMNIHLVRARPEIGGGTREPSGRICQGPDAPGAAIG
jgi:hypothetical protein